MSAHTPGPWIACQMVHAERGDLLTPEEIGEYVCNSVKKSAEESGSTAFLFVSAEKDTGPADVCHVGNGPTSPANAKLIAAAPDLLDALKEYVEWFGAVHGEDCPGDDTCTCIGGGLNARVNAAIAKAEGR